MILILPWYAIDKGIVLDKVALPPDIERLKSSADKSSIVPEDAAVNFSSNSKVINKLSGLADVDIILGPDSSPESLIPIFKLIV